MRAFFCGVGVCVLRRTGVFFCVFRQAGDCFFFAKFALAFWACVLRVLRFSVLRRAGGFSQLKSQPSDPQCCSTSAARAYPKVATFQLRTITIL